VHDEDVAGSQLDQKVLGASRHRAHGLPFQAAREITRKFVAQVRTSQNDVTYSRARHGAMESPPLVLDFWKLWHSL
jgi:hypothetical protein